MINNKIYDLATQAGLITFESIHDSMAVSPSIESVAKARKFAELIIKETLQVAKAGVEFGPSMEEAVYIYFGVEE